MFWKNKKIATPNEESCSDDLFRFLADQLKKNGRIRAEDMITAAASITGEICIEAAGNFNPRKHEFPPGRRIFSDKVNELFFGDSSSNEISSLPADSIVGTLRDAVLKSGYELSDFPDLKQIFQHFAANVGKSEWGKVPLSVPDDNKPSILPIAVTYESRSAVDKFFQTLNGPRARLRASVLTLAKVLIAVQQVMDRKLALLLALESVNGMAKTAPMTDEAMAAAKKNASGR
jgi:hypothetical protein